VPDVASGTRGGSRLWLPLLVLAVIAGTMALGAGSTSATVRGLTSSQPPRTFFSVVTWPEPTPDQDAKIMAGGGIGSVRFGFYWPSIQPLPGTTQWNVLDGEMASLARRHLRPLPVLQGMPTWLDTNPYAYPHTKLQLDAWLALLKAGVRRYGPHGQFWAEHPELPNDPIRAWQVWNEPNHYFGGLPTKGRARAYAGLLRASAEAIRSVDPSAKIVLAGLGPGLALPTQVPYYKFLNQLYGLHAQRWFDVVADHPYAPGFNAVMQQVRKTAAVMRRHHDRSPLWLTEFGWASNRPKGYRDAGLGKGPRGQATILRRSYKYLIANRRKLDLARVYWFYWIDGTKAELPEGLAFGLRRHDLSPKPAWRTFEKFAR
jgi:hypothetical protein